jgi:serine/threonine protein phosphatase 1
MNHYYVIPDIHGMFGLLRDALATIYSVNPDGGKIIFLGDYIDRGPDNRGVLKTVMNPPENWEFICLKGNHETMFVDAYINKTHFYDTEAAVDICGNPNTKTYFELHDAIDPEIVKWMDGLKLFHIEDKNVFAHAYYSDQTPPDEQRESQVIWQRMSDFETYHNDKQGFYLVHGHTPRKHGPVTSPNRLNLDAGAVFYKRLVVAKFEKGRQGAVEFMEFAE